MSGREWAYANAANDSIRCGVYTAPVYKSNWRQLDLHDRGLWVVRTGLFGVTRMIAFVRGVINFSQSATDG
jgi:hypothetical protein